MNIYSSLSELVGNTPMLDARRYAHENKLLCARFLVKLEYLNPCGSVKDRVAKSMIDDAEKRGLLHPGSTVIEPTSGNTGIGLAAVAASRGYRMIAVMPETMSAERRNILKAYGAEIVLTEGSKGMSGAIEKAAELGKMDGAFIAGQFENPANPAAHYASTGPEIWNDTDGKIDILVAGVGTGGTITGIGKYLKEKNPAIEIVAVEPKTSSVLSGGKAGAHNIQGIGAGFVPKTLDTSVYDRITPVADEDAIAAARMFGKTEGILVGISSGAALHAASETAKRKESKDKTVVVILPDSADRYYSTPLFQNL